MRDLARISRRYVGDAVRTTVPQNILLRWVTNGDLPALYRDLQAVQLARGEELVLDEDGKPLHYRLSDSAPSSFAEEESQ